MSSSEEDDTIYHDAISTSSPRHADVGMTSTTSDPASVSDGSNKRSSLSLMQKKSSVQSLIRQAENTDSVHLSNDVKDKTCKPKNEIGKVAQLKQGLANKFEESAGRSSPSHGDKHGSSHGDFVILNKPKAKQKSKDTESASKQIEDKVHQNLMLFDSSAVKPEICSVPYTNDQDHGNRGQKVTAEAGGQFQVDRESHIAQDFHGYSHVVPGPRPDDSNNRTAVDQSKPANQNVSQLDTFPADNGQPNSSPYKIEENIYDSVHVADSDEKLLGFEVVDRSTTGRSQTGDDNSSLLRKGPVKVFSEEANYEWKRREAKRKSRTMKRTSPAGKDHNPLSKHALFEDPSRGAFPEPESENIGHVNPFVVHKDSYDEDSAISYFSDSSFNSNYSDNEEHNDRDADVEDFDPNKPLPPKPPKTPHQIHVRDIANVLLLNPKHTRLEPPTLEEDTNTVLQRVESRRERRQPALPDTPDSAVMTQSQVKLRNVLGSLIDSERNYVSSLERLSNDYKEEILSHVKGRAEVKVTFDKIEDIYNLHKMFQIELAARLETWNECEAIGSIFNLFASPMARQIYSEYVNNYEAASESIRDIENTKPVFKDFLKRMQMSSSDRLSLPGLMLKPVQRFPQFIMIIKDLLKYTPRDHDDREPLQEAVTCIENVTHALNESKRQSEQLYHGQQILSKLAAKIPQEKHVFLIRQDDMEQLAQIDGIATDITDFQNPAGGQMVKQRRLFLLKDRLISVHVSNRDQDGVNVERFTYKWHQKLENLELTTSAITPNMYTKVDMKTSGTVISSPKTEYSDEDPYSVASELTDMMHDITVLAKIQQLVSSLRLSHPGLTEDQVTSNLAQLQQQIQGKDYQLQMLNSSAIIIYDRQRHKKYVFSACTANVKQDWCIDFLMAKYALNVVNIPSWHKQDKESTDTQQPALLMKHVSIDMQRTFTKMKCAVRVYFPTRNEGSVEHLWIWSSSEGQGQVSVVSLHTAKPALIESFQGARCEVITAESVPGYAHDPVAGQPAFSEDTVWTSTVDQEILVYSLREDNKSHRRPVYTFNVGCTVISMKYVDDNLFCGNRAGVVVIFNRDDVGVWSETKRLVLGLEPVNYMICVSSMVWASCGQHIYRLDIDQLDIKDRVDHQLSSLPEPPLNFQQMVKAGVGVWASFCHRPNLALYHSESRKLLQEVNICKAINEFISLYTSTKVDSHNYEVTSLMASLGLLWVGTNVGLILAYPLPRLRDGIPRIQMRPQVALHGHSGAVRFLVPVQYGPITGSPIRRRAESVIKKYNVDESVIKNLPKVPTAGIEETVNKGSQHENIYEELSPESPNHPKNEYMKPIVRTSPSSNTASAESRVSDTRRFSNMYEPIANDVGTDMQERPVFAEKQNCEENEKEHSAEHTYHVLEPGQPSKGDQAAGFDTEALSGKVASQRNHSGSPVAMKKVIQPLQPFQVSQAGQDVFPSKHGSASLRNNVPTFMPELCSKNVKRNSLEDLIDRDANADNVAALYPTLARPRTLDVRNPEEMEDPYSDPDYVRTGMKTPISAQKPDYSALRTSQTKRHTLPLFGGKSKSKDEKVEKTNDKSDKKSAAMKPSVSFSKDTNDKTATGRKQSGSSFVKGSTLDTLRKQDTNTILVLSGGDGYKDWKRRQSLPNYRPEEPILIFWMYKF